jgi:hypothetical protein
VFVLSAHKATILFCKANLSRTSININ